VADPEVRRPEIDADVGRRTLGREREADDTSEQVAVEAECPLEVRCRDDRER
jgi:hypothetical protein